MADNYLEKKFADYEARKEAARKARNLVWRKRLEAYRRKLEQERASHPDGGDEK